MSTITTVSTPHSTYSASNADETTHESAVHRDPLAELAALIVENDFVRSEADEQAMRAAREAERRAMDSQVQAMHDAADAVFLGACVQGGAALVGHHLAEPREDEVVVTGAGWPAGQGGGDPDHHPHAAHGAKVSRPCRLYRRGGAHRNSHGSSSASS